MTVQKSCVGECDGAAHQSLTLFVVVIGNRGEGVEHKRSELCILKGLTALDHLNTGVCASALVTEDRTGELAQGVLHGGLTPSVPAPHGLDTQL